VAGVAGLVGAVGRAAAPAAAAAFAASAAARALMISAAGMPKMVLVALDWRAACADGAGAGTFAGAAAAACGRFGATAGSFRGWTMMR
jgi:hypothetical protein